MRKVFLLITLFAALLNTPEASAQKPAELECPEGNTAISPFAFQRTANGKRTGTSINVSDTIPDFTLFDTACKPHSFHALVNEGKPVLFVAVSYTCPLSRASVTSIITRLDRLHHNRLKIVLVYVLEAHPAAPCISPFADSVWTGDENRKANIFYQQQQSYADRVKMAKLFISTLKLSIPVLLDSPDNRFFRSFGPLPNNGVLVGKDKRVFAVYRNMVESFSAVQFDLPLVESLSSNSSCSASELKKDSAGQPVLTLEPGNVMIQIFDHDGKLVCSFYRQSATTTEEELRNRVNNKAGEYTLRVIQQNTICLLSRFTVLQP
ncbi:MAG: hypothetical protein ACK5Z2_13515 [Bacteroidota bacterium]|jgi:hypothetical protein